jgi:hypothetical protein
MEPTPTSAPTPESARAAYDISLKLTDKLARTIWSVFAALVGTNAFFVTLATLVIQRTQTSHVLVGGLAVLGIIICFAWYLITVRSFDYYGYYFAWARKLEQDAFGGTIQMIRQGEEFSRAGIAQIGAERRQLRWSSRLFKVEWMVKLVILTFIAVYGYLLVATLRGAA